MPGCLAMNLHGTTAFSYCLLGHNPEAVCWPELFSFSTDRPIYKVNLSQKVPEETTLLIINQSIYIPLLIHPGHLLTLFHLFINKLREVKKKVYLF